MRNTPKPDCTSEIALYWRRGRGLKCREQSHTLRCTKQSSYDYESRIFSMASVPGYWWLKRQQVGVTH